MTRGLSLRKGLTAAAKADVASLTAFEIGLFGGFFTSWPVNRWLIRAGIKEAM